ncbi:MAG: hypothetical protein WAL32_10985 [Terriglobales bacterium]
METATGTAENRSEQPAKVVETAGMVFADGSALELVSTSAYNKPALLLWKDGKAPIVAPRVERAGTFYRPPSADPSVWLATTLPTEVVDRGPAAELFSETAALLKKYVGVSTAEGALVTAWNATTWFVDVLLNLATLFIYGWDMIAAMRLLRLLSCIGRHALILSDIDGCAIRWLTKIQPTLLLAQPQMSLRLRNLCSASNFKGLVVPEPKGTVRDAACSKAIFLGNPVAPLSDPGIHFFLPPGPTDCPPLDVATQLQIKQRFQPWYASYRLAHLQEVQQSRFVGTDLSSPMGEIEAMLQSCTRNDGQLKLEWAPLLKSQEQDALAQRSWDPVAAHGSSLAADTPLRTVNRTVNQYERTHRICQYSAALAWGKSGVQSRGAGGKNQEPGCLPAPQEFGHGPFIRPTHPAPISPNSPQCRCGEAYGRVSGLRRDANCC